MSMGLPQCLHPQQPGLGTHTLRLCPLLHSSKGAAGSRIGWDLCMCVWGLNFAATGLLSKPLSLASLQAFVRHSPYAQHSLLAKP